ncbi:MAG TPA: MBL fold metallo-hydrolase [Kofleriaceae bacterium]|nr:MBL fold metallo-hydrolase [Kofleriaceae bacterium]
MNAPSLVSLVSLAAFVSLVACSSSTPKTTPPSPAGGDGGRIHRFRIGALDAIALSDGTVSVPNDGAVFAVGHAEEAADLLALVGMPRDELHLSIQPLLVKADTRVLLFDTGARDAIATAGRLPASLALAGVTPGDVTDIFISHAHSDHVFGLVTAAGARAFPTATIHLSAPEWAALEAEEPAFAASIAANVKPFAPGAQVLPEVLAVETRGHTAGHSSYLVGTGDDRLLYLGDVAHHTVVSLQRPAWSVAVDSDHASADAVRAQTLSRLAAAHTRVYAVHFPFPGLGHVVDQDGAFAWQAE